MSKFFSINGWSIFTWTHKRCLHARNHCFTPRSFSCRLELDLRFQKRAKHLFCPLLISFHDLYHLRLPTKTLFSLVKRFLRTRDVSVCYRSQHMSHKSHKFVSVLSGRCILSGPGSTPLTAIAVRKVDQDQVHLFLQTRTVLQTMQVSQLNETWVLDEEVLSPGDL